MDEWKKRRVGRYKLELAMASGDDLPNLVEIYVERLLRERREQMQIAAASESGSVVLSTSVSEAPLPSNASQV